MAGNAANCRGRPVDFHRAAIGVQAELDQNPMPHQPRKVLGSLEAVCIKPGSGLPTKVLESAECIAGFGLEQDYATVSARASNEPGKKRQVTLIGIDAIAHVEKELGVAFTHALSRRNLLTRGVELNSLVGREFWIGDVRLLGTSLCHPCSDLEKMTFPGVMAALKDRGGLCAQVLTGGKLAPGMLLTA